MEAQSQLIPRISFKGVFIFMLVLFISLLFLSDPLLLLGFSKSVSYFITTSIGATVGSIIVLLKIDAKHGDSPLFKKRIVLSFIIGFTSSALMIFIFGGDVLG